MHVYVANSLYVVIFQTSIRRESDRMTALRSAPKKTAHPDESRDYELDAMLKDFRLPEVVSHLLRRAHFRAEELFSSAIGRDGLTPRQKALLITSYQHPGSNQRELAKNIAIDRNSFTEMLARMIRAGYLTRRRAENDGRSNQIFITRHGIEALKRIMPLDQRVERAIIEPLPMELRQLFTKCLQKMLEMEEASN